MRALIFFIFFAVSLFNCTFDNITQTGTALFYTHTQLYLNCGPLEVEIFINGENKGKLALPLLPLDSIPNCNSIDSLAILKIELPIGHYNYVAHSSPCDIEDRYGQFIITEGSCTIIQVKSDFEENAILPIQIKSDKTLYSSNEVIKVEVKNVSDSLALYYKCSSVDGIPVNIYKFGDKTWNAYSGPLCDGYQSFCCRELIAGESYKDTLEFLDDKGTYLLEYQFIVRPSHEYVSYYSNSFNIE